MNVIGVIPARWGSTRFEGKILAKIAGKPMIQHVFERVCRAKHLDDILIATDDKRILTACEDFGAKVVMTSAEHASGTDRIAEAVAEVPTEYVINIQGDEPLIEPDIIDRLAEILLERRDVMATVVCPLVEKDKNNPNAVKTAVDKEGYALSFSRSYEKLLQQYSDAEIRKHLGIYGYKKDFLLGYKGLPVSQNEQEERLEQLRALDAGFKIKTVQTNMETIGVDTPEDLAKVEQLLS